MKTLLIPFVLLTSLTIHGQQATLIKNVTLFDGENVSEKTDVLVQGDTVAEIGTISRSDHTVIDGSGKFLMPALTNAHVHAWSQASLREAAKAGVLNVMDMHGVEPYQKPMTALKDSTDYANYYIAGYAATAPEGHGTQYGFPVPTISNEDEAVRFVNDRVDFGADYIKIIVEPWKKTLDSSLVKAVIGQAHKKDKIAVVHVSRASDAVMVLKNNADGLVHIWDDMVLAEEQLDMIKDRDFFVIPTLLTNIKLGEMKKKSNPNAEFLSEEELKSEVKRLYVAGVPILAGTDPPNLQINYGTDLYKELKLFLEAGIPAIDVLKSATSLPVQKFKLGKIGLVKPGYQADLLLINGNPIENMDALNKIEMIWKSGKQLKL